MVLSLNRIFSLLLVSSSKLVLDVMLMGGSSTSVLFAQSENITDSFRTCALQSKLFMQLRHYEEKHLLID